MSSKIVKCRPKSSNVVKNRQMSSKINQNYLSSEQKMLYQKNLLYILIWSFRTVSVYKLSWINHRACFEVFGARASKGVGLIPLAAQRQATNIWRKATKHALPYLYSLLIQPGIRIAGSAQIKAALQLLSVCKFGLEIIWGGSFVLGLNFEKYIFFWRGLTLSGKATN